MSDNKMMDRAQANVQDVAEHFGVSERTVRRWLKYTDIPHRRVRNTIRFNLDEVDLWSSRGGRPAIPDEDEDDEAE